jgi:hypothetical protein
VISAAKTCTFDRRSGSICNELSTYSVTDIPDSIWWTIANITMIKISARWMRARLTASECRSEVDVDASFQTVRNVNCRSALPSLPLPSSYSCHIRASHPPSTSLHSLIAQRPMEGLATGRRSDSIRATANTLLAAH